VIWRAKAILKSHLDPVRSLAFLPTSELALVSGSDDGTAKLWNLRPVASSRRTPADVEPVFTFRGHTAGVTSVSVSTDGRTLYSGSLDSTVMAWKIPNVAREMYTPTDAVWAVRPSPQPQHVPLLASASADGTVRLWNARHDASAQDKLFATLRHPSAAGISSGGRGPLLAAPAAVDWLPTYPRRLAVAFRNSTVLLYDVEKATPVLELDSSMTFDGTAATQINSIVCHPTLPLLVSAHEDRYLRFFDLNTGKRILRYDSVSSVDILADGSAVISGGHDCSVRWWDVAALSSSLASTSSSTEAFAAASPPSADEAAGAAAAGPACLQEFPAHRPRFDEGVCAVRAHPALPGVAASAGADAACRVFFHGDASLAAAAAV
ncbi:hypothetical protein HK405_014515, partial [Cladochytrium tenue]